MLTIKTTPALTGVCISGDYDDLNRLYDAVTAVIGNESYEGYYENETRLLGLCYEIRHAYQGDRETFLSEDKAKYYSFFCLWPETVFAAAALGDFIGLAESKQCWLDNNPPLLSDEQKSKMKQQLPYDIAYLRYIQKLIFCELRRTVGNKRYKSLCSGIDFEYLFSYGTQHYKNYHRQMIDILNVKYLRRTADKRESYLATVSGMILKPNMEYESVAQAVEEYAKEDNVPAYEVELEGMQYPENIVW